MKKNNGFKQWLKSRPDGKAPLINSHEDLDYESYLEWCYDMDEEPAEENSDKFYDWVAEEQENIFECDKENLKYSRTIKDYKVLITGQLGLWWGRPTIKPEIMDNLLDAIMRCAEDRVESVYDEKCVYVDAPHHDGCNCFQLYLIKPNVDINKLEERIEEIGYDYNPENAYERRFFEKITDYLF